MGVTDPTASRHLAEVFARSYTADMDVATRNVAHGTLCHRRRGKHPTRIADKLIRHRRNDPKLEEVRALEASKRQIEERLEAELAGGAMPAAAGEA